MVYKFYNDPGHGWLAVKRAELIRLGILDKITGYSYQNGNTVYLEEDCDATTFINRKDELGEPYSFDNRYTNKQSPIRYYQSFKP